MRTNRVCAAAAACVALVALGGCSKYLLVEDTQTGNIYYTKTSTFERAAATGSVFFTDASDGSSVTLPGSKITKIEKDEFEEGLERVRRESLDKGD